MRDSNTERWVLQCSSWLDDCVERGVNTTVWEDEFLERQVEKRRRFGDHWEPSEKEAAIIERIYTERVP